MPQSWSARAGSVLLVPESTRGALPQKPAAEPNCKESLQKKFELFRLTCAVLTSNECPGASCVCVLGLRTSPKLTQKPTSGQPRDHRPFSTIWVPSLSWGTGFTPNVQTCRPYPESLNPETLMSGAKTLRSGRRVTSQS